MTSEPSEKLFSLTPNSAVDPFEVIFCMFTPCRALPQPELQGTSEERFENAQRKYLVLLSLLFTDILYIPSACCRLNGFKHLYMYIHTERENLLTPFCITCAMEIHSVSSLNRTEMLPLRNSFLSCKYGHFCSDFYSCDASD